MTPHRMSMICPDCERIWFRHVSKAELLQENARLFDELKRVDVARAVIYSTVSRTVTAVDALDRIFREHAAKPAPSRKWAAAKAWCRGLLTWRRP